MAPNNKVGGRASVPKYKDIKMMSLDDFDEDGQPKEQPEDPVNPKTLMEDAFRKAHIEIRDSWRQRAPADVDAEPPNNGVWPSLSFGSLDYDTAVAHSDEVYDNLSDNCKMDFPDEYWNLALDFVEELMVQKPDKPFKWAERWFLQRAIEKERRFGHTTQSLELILADDDNVPDPFHLEKFIQQVMDQGASRGQEKMGIEDFLYHVRTFAGGVARVDDFVE